MGRSEQGRAAAGLAICLEKSGIWIMRTVCLVMLISMVLPLAPAFALDPDGGSGAVAGEGPGGSGAGQSSYGPSKSFLSPRIRARQHYRAFYARTARHVQDKPGQQ